MKTVTIILQGTMLFYFVSCNESANNIKKTTSSVAIPDSAAPFVKDKERVDPYSLVEQRIIDTICSLPEVRQRAKHIEEQTMGKRHIVFWIEPNPAEGARYYDSVKAGEDNGMSLVTHFSFFVYPDSMKILYQEPLSDSAFSFETWRKMKSR